MILFRKQHRATILAGTKTATRRNWEKARAVVGSVHQLKTELFGDAFAHVLVEAVYRQQLGAMTEADAAAEGGYTLETFRALWSEMNGGDFDPDLEVWVVEFSLVGKSQEAAIVRRELER